MRRHVARLFLCLVFCVGGSLASRAESPSWSCHGPYGGRIRALAVSPDYVTDHTLFAGADPAGLFLSTDAGATWRRASGLPTGAIVSSIAASPDFAQDRSVYLSTTEAGLFASTDGGETWVSWSADPAVLSVAQITLSPTYTTDYTLLAATGRGLYLGDGAHRTWEAVDPGVSALCVTIAPRLGSAFVAFGGTALGLYRSTDSGHTWVPTELSGVPVLALALSPRYGEDSTVLAGTLRGAYLSSDGGASWHGPWLEEQVVRQVLFSPRYAADQRMFLGTEEGVYSSTSGLGAWVEVSRLDDTLHALAAAPGAADGLVIYVGTERGGVLASADAAVSWRARNAGLANVPLVAVAASPAYATDHTVLAGGPSGVWRSVDDGLSWHATSLAYAEVRALHFSPGYATDGTIFAATDTGVFISRDGGRTWNVAREGLGMPDVRGLAFGAAKDIWAATAVEGVYYSATDGASWEGRSDGLAHSALRSIAWLSQTISATHLIAGSWGAGVFASGDGGRFWSPAASSPETPYIRDLVATLDYAGRVVAFAGTLAGAYRSIDRGATWAFIGPPGRDIRAIAPHPDYAHNPTCYLGSGGDGVWVSSNGGLTWNALNAGLGNLGVGDLAVARGASGLVVFAATQGSAWRYGSPAAPMQHVVALPIVLR